VFGYIHGSCLGSGEAMACRQVRRNRNFHFQENLYPQTVAC
jgi:hypothetical protein